MSFASRTGRRPVSVYVTAQLVGIALAAGATWVLWTADAVPWPAVVAWLGVSAHLSRKRLPTEVLGSALQVVALLALAVPILPVVSEVAGGGEVTAVDVATALFGPALAVLVLAAAAFQAGRLLKRRARRQLRRRRRRELAR